MVHGCEALVYGAAETAAGPSSSASSAAATIGKSSMTCGCVRAVDLWIYALDL